MKVRELLEEIKRYTDENPDILDYDVYTEQLTEQDKEYKRKPCKEGPEGYNEGNGQGWEYIKDSEEWEYFKVHGYNTVFNKEKIFTINVNY